MEFSFLQDCILFKNIPTDDIAPIIACLDFDLQEFQKGQTVYHAGDHIKKLGIIKKGSVNIESTDMLGNNTILDNISRGQIFAETYACLPQATLMVDVIAAENTIILFIDPSQLWQSDKLPPPQQKTLWQNLLQATAQKNLNLSRRIFHTSAKTIRERLISYLSAQALDHESNSFYIPFDRQQLADYLNVDRSALSNELSKMRKENLLDFHKNHFVLKN